MAETLVVSLDRDQCYSKSKAGNGHPRFRSFGSPPCRGGFRDIDFGNFQPTGGILPTPIKIYATPFTKQGFSPKTPSPSVNESKPMTKSAKSSSVPIPININADFNEMSYSERWAGPTYSNSPPPSSLPIPKFSSRPKRTVSLDLPSSSAPRFNFFSTAKSAPASPTRDHDGLFSGNLDNSDEYATKTLRRILNLDSADE